MGCRDRPEHGRVCETGAAKIVLRNYSELCLDAGLFAEFVGGNSIDLFVSFDWNDLRSIRVNGMIGTLSEEIETMLFQVSNKITSFDRHAQHPCSVVQ